MTIDPRCDLCARALSTTHVHAYLVTRSTGRRVCERCARVLDDVERVDLPRKYPPASGPRKAFNPRVPVSVPRAPRLRAGGERLLASIPAGAKFDGLREIVRRHFAAEAA